MTSIPTPVLGSPHAAIAAMATARTMRRSTSADLQRRTDRRSAPRIVDHVEDQAVVVAADGRPGVVPHVPQHRHVGGSRCNGDGIDREVSHRGGPMKPARLNERIERSAERARRWAEADGRADGLADRVRGLHDHVDLSVWHGRRYHKIADRRRSLYRRRGAAGDEHEEREERRGTPHRLRLLGMGAEEDLLQVRTSRTETADEEDADEKAAKSRDEADHDVHGPQALRADES